MKLPDDGVAVRVNGTPVVNSRVWYDHMTMRVCVDVDYGLDAQMADHLDKLPTLSEVVRQWTEHNES